MNLPIDQQPSGSGDCDLQTAAGCEAKFAFLGAVVLSRLVRLCGPRSDYVSSSGAVPCRRQPDRPNPRKWRLHEAAAHMSPDIAASDGALTSCTLTCRDQEPVLPLGIVTFLCRREGHGNPPRGHATGRDAHPPNGRQKRCDSRRAQTECPGLCVPLRRRGWCRCHRWSLR